MPGFRSAACISRLVLTDTSEAASTRAAQSVCAVMTVASSTWATSSRVLTGYPDTGYPDTGYPVSGWIQSREEMAARSSPSFRRSSAVSSWSHEGSTQHA